MSDEEKPKLVLQGVFRRREEIPDIINILARGNNHGYYSEKYGREFVATILRWERTKSFDVAATLDADRLQVTARTLYQKLHHGRRWAIEHSDDVELIKKLKAVKMVTSRSVVKLTFMKDGYVVESMEDALEFGEEREDNQAAFQQWIESNPPDGVTWPPTKIIMDDQDIDWFTQARDVIMKQAQPRFVFEITGNMVKVTSILHEAY